MNNELLDKCLNYDKEWNKFFSKTCRKRKIYTEIIFKTLISSAVTNIGVSSCLQSFNGNFSHTALNKARNKLNDNLFKNINDNINKRFKNNIDGTA